MATWQQLADRMFPDVEHTPEEYEALYPPRALKEGARVTRIAPSPTGYLHLGVLFTATINRLTANASNGLFYFRLEDTDKKREVAGGAEDILKGLADYGVNIDEGFVAPGEIKGDYGPYQQSQRGVSDLPFYNSVFLLLISAFCLCFSGRLCMISTIRHFIHHMNSDRIIFHQFITIIQLNIKSSLMITWS